MRLEAIQISYGHGRAGYPSISLYTNVLMNLAYLQIFIQRHSTLQRLEVPFRHFAVSQLNSVMYSNYGDTNLS